MAAGTGRQEQESQHVQRVEILAELSRYSLVIRQAYSSMLLLMGTLLSVVTVPSWKVVRISKGPGPRPAADMAHQPPQQAQQTRSISAHMRRSNCSQSAPA